jgi:hypothetical protein
MMIATNIIVVAGAILVDSMSRSNLRTDVEADNVIVS